MGTLIDVLTENTAPDGPAPLPPDERLRLANEMVAASLDERAHLEAMDTYGTRKKCRRFLTGPNAPVFRRALEDWLVSASALLAGVEVLQASGQAVARLGELKFEIASTRTMLSFTLERIEEGMDRVRQGHYVTLEEGRRELRAQGRE